MHGKAQTRVMALEGLAAYLHVHWRTGV